MKKLYLIFLLIFLLILNISCTSEKDSTSNINTTKHSSLKATSTAEPNITTKASNKQIFDPNISKVMGSLQIYNKILLYDYPFYDANYEAERTLTQELDSLEYPEWKNSMKFTLIDLDYDDMPELILWYASSPHALRSIFDYNNKQVYKFDFTHRQFGYLKTDSTFMTSSSASNWGFNTISFQKDNYLISPYTYTLVDEASGSSLYYVDNRKVNEETFDNAFSSEQQKDDALWYEFSKDAIDNYFENYSVN